MASADQSSRWEYTSEVVHRPNHTGITRLGSTPNVHLFQRNLNPFERLIEPPSTDGPSSWPSRNAPLFGGAFEPGFSKRKLNHTPIVISQDVVDTVRRQLPESPLSAGSDGRTSDSSTSEASSGTRVVIQSVRNRQRHIPIVIPSFAHPKDQYPPTPTHSPPKASPHKPYSCKSFYPIMAQRPTTSDSINSMTSPSQTNMGRFQSGSGGTYLADVNSSQSSLTQSEHDMQTAEQPLRQARSGDPSPYAGITSPAIGQQSQAINGTTNLSGLVCNVHKCTGKEPHALVGATTTVLGDKLYVFGGRILSRRRPQLTSDLYELDLVKRHWTRIEATGDVPPPRYFHSVCSLGDTKLICYGGMSPATAISQSQTSSQEPQPEVVVMSDIHLYDASTRAWTHIATTDTPQGRYAHCAAVLPSKAVFTSANAPLSAIHHNPASANPNQGSIGVALDGTGGAEMVVVGGQDSANHYIEQVSVFNLRSLKWTSTSVLGRSCGAYRSVVVPLTTMASTKIGKGVPNEVTEDTNGPTEEDDDSDASMLIYSNYNFLDVKLELQVRMSDGSLAEKPMHGQFSPPGLRFPNGGVLDNHFVVSGTYLTSSKQEYALWALDLRTLTWSRIDAGGGVFSQGSWNRGILWPRRNTFVILGNRKRSLVEDYNHRRINFTNICMVELEAFGLYDNPRHVNPTSSFPSISAPILPHPLTFRFSSSLGPYCPAAIDLGHKAMDFRELADMDLLAIGGERIPVNSYLLSRRWGPYFVQLLRESAASSPTSLYPTDTTSSNSEVSTLRPSLHPSASTASRNSSITITPSIQTNNSAGQSTLNAPSTTSKSTNSSLSKRDPFEPPTPFTLSSSSRPRQLYLPHTLLTLRALVHFLYTSSLPPATHSLSTPQILCSLLQLARPYRVDGLLEAVVERLHQVLDGRNAAAVFNAAAMAAGGGRGTGSIFGREGEPLLEDANDPAIDPAATGLTARRNPPQRAEPHHQPPSPSESDDDTRSDVSGSTVESSVASSADYSVSASGASVEDGEDEVWQGGVSCVVGLQKRGLRGLMEGRRMRERGKGTGNGVNGHGAGNGNGNGNGGGTVGLGIV